MLLHSFEGLIIQREQKHGPPSQAQIVANARTFKLIVGFGGIAVILITEWLLFKEPLIRDLSAIQQVISGAKLTPVITNGLVRDLLMSLMLVIGIFGLIDVFQKPKAVTA